MITLNLLSAEYKEKIKLRKIYRQINNFLSLILIFLILASIILLVAKIVLQNNFNELVSINNLVKQNKPAVSEEAKKLNIEIKAANQIQKRFIPWPKIISNFTNAVPDNLEIRSLKIEPAGWLITGEVKNRETLLKFEDDLNKLGYFKTIKSPITNLLKKENIDFELEASPNFEVLQP